MKAIIAKIVKLLLKSRYRVKVDSKLGDRSLSGALILPNHPAEIDPVIVSAHLWSMAAPRPVVLETIFEMPVLRKIFEYLGAIAMPDMEQGSGFYKRKRIKDTLDNVVLALNGGDNVLIYPSGRLSVTGKEVIGAASGAYKIIQRLQGARIILVRSSGLWGSRFSKAQTGGLRPDLGSAFLSSLKTIIKNFVFFVPKRHVGLTLEEFPIDELKSKSQAELNSFLEAWYAKDSSTEPLFISESFIDENDTFKPEIKIVELKEEPPVKLDESKRVKIFSYLSKISETAVTEITQSSRLSEDLGLDSLTIAELITWLHDELDCNDVELAELSNVTSVLRAAARDHGNSSASKATPTPFKWSKDSNLRQEPELPLARTIAEAFIHSVKRNKSLAACSDPRLGIKSFEELLLASLVLKSHFEKIPNKYVGVLLPASGMSAIVTFAILLARKTPVFLNWTAGSKALEHSITMLSIEKIVTAGAVLDTINQDLSVLDSKFLLLEEIKSKTNLKTKITSFLLTKLSAETLISKLELGTVAENDPAVVLFTSGSEAAPKAVPLSNNNLLENIRSITQTFDFKLEDVVYGFLPPFHSFGLTVTTLMPILSGLRVSFYPNPNESRKIAEGCATWQVSAMAGTPSFIKGILSAGNPQNFSKLRLLMSGADRLSDEIRELCKRQAPNAQLLEGYGITECSPVVCAQKPDEESQGVGPALPNVKLKIVDLNSMEEVKDGERGLVLISGPNVFPGYLGQAKDPFIEKDGIQWYNSGDLGYISDGSLVLAGRLKRFIKIGGEMISLPAIEDALIKNLTKGENIPALAVIDYEEKENQRPMLTVFSNQKDLNKEAVQAILKEQGFPPLVKIHDVKCLEELPMLGTGKIDIQALKRIPQSK